MRKSYSTRRKIKERLFEEGMHSEIHNCSITFIWFAVKNILVSWDKCGKLSLYQSCNLDDETLYGFSRIPTVVMSGSHHLIPHLN